MKPTLIFKDVKDTFTRENFNRINDANNQTPFILADFKIITIDIPSAISHFRYAHNLGFKPLDAWTTSRTGTYIETWNYELFDSEFIDLSATGPITLRAVIGRFK